MPTDQHLAETIAKVRENHGLQPSPAGLCGDVTNLSNKLDLVTRDYRRLVSDVDGAVRGAIPRQAVRDAKHSLGIET